MERELPIYKRTKYYLSFFLFIYLQFCGSPAGAIEVSECFNNTWYVSELYECIGCNSPLSFHIHILLKIQLIHVNASLLISNIIKLLEIWITVDNQKC